MSDIIIEDKNLNEIDEFNFQTVGPYTNQSEFDVEETIQGRNIVGGEETDKRFSLGTYTENNRKFWEENIELTVFEKEGIINQATSSLLYRSGSSGYDEIFGDTKDFVIPISQNFSVDCFTYRVVDNETYPMFFYYDKTLHKEEYEATVEGKVSMKIIQRETGRTNRDGETTPTYFNPFIERTALNPIIEPQPYFEYRISSVNAFGNFTGDFISSSVDYGTSSIFWNQLTDNEINTFFQKRYVVPSDLEQGIPHNAWESSSMISDEFIQKKYILSARRVDWGGSWQNIGPYFDINELPTASYDWIAPYLVTNQEDGGEQYEFAIKLRGVANGEEIMSDRIITNHSLVTLPFTDTLTGLVRVTVNNSLNQNGFLVDGVQLNNGDSFILANANGYNINPETEEPYPETLSIQAPSISGYNFSSWQFLGSNTEQASITLNGNDESSNPNYITWTNLEFSNSPVFTEMELSANYTEAAGGGNAMWGDVSVDFYMNSLGDDVGSFQLNNDNNDGTATYLLSNDDNAVTIEVAEPYNEGKGWNNNPEIGEYEYSSAISIESGWSENEDERKIGIGPNRVEEQTGQSATLYWTNNNVNDYDGSVKIKYFRQLNSGDTGGGTCFLEGTMITMADGTTKPIEEIKVGDVVMSYDEDTKTIVNNKVVETMFHTANSEHLSYGKYLIINNTMRVTINHAILADTGGRSPYDWPLAEVLKVGDYLYDKDLNKVRIHTIESVDAIVDTYNFEVENSHTYIAENYIVHNIGGDGPGSGKGDRPIDDQDEQVTFSIYNTNQ